MNYPNFLLVLYGDNVYEFFDLPTTQTEDTIYTFEQRQTYKAYSYFKLENARITLLQHNNSDIQEAINAKMILNTGAFFVRRSIDFSYSFNSDIGEFFLDKRVSIQKLAYWRDLGHQDIIFGDDPHFDTRSFNELQISQDRLSLVKRSTEKKIKDEIAYLMNLPDQFAFLFPRIRRTSHSNEWEYEMEYIPARPLSEYLCFWKLHPASWTQVFEQLMGLVCQFRDHRDKDAINITLNSEKRKALYLKMFNSRKSQFPKELSRVTKCSSISINGKEIKGLPTVIDRFEQDLIQMSNSLEVSFYHGDLGLSNILFHPPSGLIKLIDPKGSLFEEGKCLGDYRYDVAKLFHSVVYGYDFVNYQLYSVGQLDSTNQFNLKFIGYQDHKWVSSAFIGAVNSRFSSETLRSIKILTAMLFLNMIPLHSDSSEKQLAYLLIAILILNEIYNDEGIFDIVLNSET